MKCNTTSHRNNCENLSIKYIKTRLKKPQNPEDFPAIIFSHPAWGCACMSCIITRKSRASIRGKLHHCQTYMRHFSHRRKYTACSSRDSFLYSDLIPSFHGLSITSCSKLAGCQSERTLRGVH